MPKEHNESLYSRAVYEGKQEELASLEQERVQTEASYTEALAEHAALRQEISEGEPYPLTEEEQELREEMEDRLRPIADNIKRALRDQTKLYTTAWNEALLENALREHKAALVEVKKIHEAITEIQTRFAGYHEEALSGRLRHVDRVANELEGLLSRNTTTPEDEKYIHELAEEFVEAYKRLRETKHRLLAQNIRKPKGEQ